MGSSFASVINILGFLIPLSWMIIHLVRYHGPRNVYAALSFLAGFSLVIFFFLDFSLNQGFSYVWWAIEYFPKIFPTLFSVSVFSIFSLIFLSVQPTQTRIKRKIALRLPILGALISYFFESYYIPVFFIFAGWIILLAMIDRFRSVFYLYTKGLIFLVIYLFLTQFFNHKFWIYEILLVPVLIYLGQIINQFLIKSSLRKFEEIEL
jgi:hypothetical protein